MSRRRVRIGIDVGGTFTKAVAIDDETYDLVGKSEVLTTHYAPEGVARGVIEVFQKILEDYDINPEDVVFVAHSTTQATNALLEGDVVPVGIIGMGSGIEGFLASRETSIGDIKLAPGRILKTYSKFIDSSKIDENMVKQGIRELRDKGARSIAASEAFGVDKTANEVFVMKMAHEVGLPATAGHVITKLYNLTIRTRTAAINASILPKMMETANMTESSMRKAGIRASLMIMRGDGGVMSIDEMRERPILTMLSGPSASVAGALMYLRVSNGIFFEVGGTSTNIGVIRYGKPTLRYVELGGHHTFLHSLDVRVRGIAGGSMIRVKGGKIVDVGPRSAHIAGLPYSAFAKTEEIVAPKLKFIQPRPGDPSDYVVLKCANGKTFALTNTCAANALGIAKPKDYAHGNPDAARKAFEPLAEKLGLTVEETARRVLEVASKKIIGVIEALIEDYKLEREHVVLVGGGGGAAALIPFTAKILGMNYEISENAEVISSIGVSLAMVREMVERTIPNPQPRDILAIKQEAKAAAMASGAQPETVEVYVEVDPQRKRVRAIALGSTELRSKDLLKKITVEEARSLVARNLKVKRDDVELVETIGGMHVFKSEMKKRGFVFSTTKRSVMVVDRYGFVKLWCSGGVTVKSSVQRAVEDLKMLWEKETKYDEEYPLPPDVFVIVKGHLIDLSGLRDSSQAVAIITPEIKALDTKEKVVLIGVRAGG